LADLEADRLRALMRATVFGQPREPVMIDRYEIVRLMGSGAMGLVYEVFDPMRGEQVALKILRGHSPRALTLFKREFRALSRITHPNLVGLYELGRDQYQFFFTMELIRGVTLLKYLWATDPAEHSPDDELRLTPVADFARLRGVFAQLVDGIQALHQAHKLHRDIKPTNVMVTHRGRVVLMDFGFVGDESVGTLESTAGSMVVGTPAYMAPEQALGGPRTPPSDYYSLGATLYMALTGHVPFHGHDLAAMMQLKQTELPIPPRALVTGVPDDLEALCMQLLRPTPGERPSGAELLGLLHHAAEVSHTRGGAHLSPAATHVGARRFIGRAAEVDALRRAYALVCTEGRPSVILVRGHAGLGKSALIRHVTDELRSTAVVLRARCYERDGVPLKALDSLVDALARHLRQHPRPELAPAVAALAPLFPVLQTGDHDHDGPGPARPGPDSLLRARGARGALAQSFAERPAQPSELGAEAFAALRLLLARLTAPRPLVLWIDDLQWGDVDSVRALQRLLAPPDPPPVLLIASYRSEDSHTSPALHALEDMSKTPGVGLQIIELAPLDPDETLALAAAVLGADTAAGRLTQLAAEAQGSPQFLHDLARFVAHGSTAAPEVTLDELLEIRIGRLGDAQRRLLDLVAVAGAPLPATLALRAAEAQQDARAVVHPLLGMGLLRSLSAADGERLDTLHERTREVVLAQLDGSALRVLHATLAAALALEPAPDPEQLSRLFRGAGDLPRALHYAEAAARIALDAGQFERAAELLLRAAELGPGEASRFHFERAVALARAGRSRAAAEAYLAARTGADEPAALRYAAAAATLLLTSGHLEAGREVLASSFPAAGLTPPVASVRGKLASLWRRGRIATRGIHWQERPITAIPPVALGRVDLLRAAALGAMATDPGIAADVQAQHLLLALQTGEPVRIGRALALEAAHAAYTAPHGSAGWARAETLLAEARALAERLGDGETAFLADLAGLLTPALDLHALRARAEALADSPHADLALPYARACVQFHVLRTLAALGDWQTLAHRLPAVLTAARGSDDRCALVWLHGLELWLRLTQGDLEGARRSLADADAAWPYSPAHGYHVQHLQLAEARVALHLYAGEPARPLAQQQQDAPLLARAGLLHAPSLRFAAAELWARTSLAAFRQQSGDPAMRRAAVRAVDDLQALGPSAHATLLRARLLPESAESLLREAAAKFAVSGHRMHEATALLRLRDPAGAAALRALGVADPERLAAVLAP